MDPGFAFIVLGGAVVAVVIAISWRNAGAPRRRGSDGSYVVGAGLFGADSGTDHSHGPGHGHGHGGDSGGHGGSGHDGHGGSGHDGGGWGGGDGGGGDGGGGG